MNDWRTLAWMPEYEISEDGQVRRAIAARTRPAGFILKQSLRNQYLRVKVTLQSGGACPNVHRLVCEAFHGAPPSTFHHAAHIDGNKLNNRASNLRWATPKENNADRILHGTDGSGDRNSRALLTWPVVREIRAKYDGTWSHICSLADEYGLSRTGMASVCRNRNWRETNGQRRNHLPVGEAPAEGCVTHRAI